MAIAGEEKAFPILTQILKSDGLPAKAEITGTHMRIKSLCDRSRGQCKSGGLTTTTVDGVEKVTEDRWFWDPAGEAAIKTYTESGLRDGKWGSRMSLEDMQEVGKSVADVQAAMYTKEEAKDAGFDTTSVEASRWAAHRRQSTQPPPTSPRAA